MTDQFSASAKRRGGKRDPEGTHERILAAAREILAKDGAEGLTIDQVAERACVNRSTAYQHFPTRDLLVEATAVSVSDSLCEAVFGGTGNPPRELTVEGVTEYLVQFAMENPELGCVWLTQFQTVQQPGNDRFFRLFVAHLEAFAKTENAQPGIDAEVHAVVVLAATFLWPLWARAHTLDANGRRQMAQRFTCEMLRLSLHGAVRSA